MARDLEVLGEVYSWEKVDDKLQTKEFFAFVRVLNNKGLKPKT
jgi:hypothetical protein